MCVCALQSQTITKCHTTDTSHNSMSVLVQDCLLHCCRGIHQSFIKNMKPQWFSLSHWTESISTRNASNVPDLLMWTVGCACTLDMPAVGKPFFFLPHACSFVSLPLSPSHLTLYTASNRFAMYEKLHWGFLFGGSGGFTWRHWGIAKMAAVSEGMKTVTLRYQSFHSVPCPCRSLLCALCCSYTGAADELHHICWTRVNNNMRNRCIEVIWSGVNTWEK